MKCKIERCTSEKIAALGLCNAHYLRQRRYGRLHSIKNTYGTGGLRPDGYKYVSHEGRRILEHRLFMELHLGRRLQTHEVIHHIDGNKLNNAITNLALTTHSSHRSLHKGQQRKPFSPQAIENMRKAAKMSLFKHKRDPLTWRFSKKT